MKNLLAAASIATCLLTACGAPEDGEPSLNAPAPPSPSSAGDPAPAAETASAPLPAGTHCYFRDDESTTEALEVTVTDAGVISGANYGTIHQEEEAYYASFTIDLTEGEVGADGLVTFDSVTEVDGDTQFGPMVWTLSPDAAAPEGFLDQPLAPADCDGLEDRVFPPM